MAWYDWKRGLVYGCVRMFYGVMSLFGSVQRTLCGASLCSFLELDLCPLLSAGTGKRKREKAFPPLVRCQGQTMTPSCLDLRY